jgi:hypothetical protein
MCGLLLLLPVHFLTGATVFSRLRRFGHPTCRARLPEWLSVGTYPRDVLRKMGSPLGISPHAACFEHAVVCEACGVLRRCGAEADQFSHQETLW